MKHLLKVIPVLLSLILMLPSDVLAVPVNDGQVYIDKTTYALQLVAKANTSNALVGKEPGTPALLYWKTKWWEDRGGLFLVPEGDKNQEIKLAGGRARYGEISPDGSKVVFQGYDGDMEIYIVNLKDVMDGEWELKKLTNNSEDDRYPTWSPDGKKVAFVRDHDHDNYEDAILYTMEADGSKEEKIRHFNTYVAYLKWHPKDKNKILFEHNLQLHTINSSGEDLKQITDEYRSSKRIYYTMPSWSNDGKSIVARYLNDDKMHILNANGSLKRRVSYDSLYPQYSPDNNELAFRRSGSYIIDYVNADQSNYQESIFVGNPSDWGLIQDWGN